MSLNYSRVGHLRKRDCYPTWDVLHGEVFGILQLIFGMARMSDGESSHYPKLSAA